MSRTKSLIIALSVFVLGYIVSYFYSNMILETEYVLGINQKLFYLFYIPLLYFIVCLMMGRPAFGKYKDAIVYFAIALLRILYDYIVKNKPVLGDIFFACLGLLVLLVILKFFIGEVEVKHLRGRK